MTINRKEFLKKACFAGAYIWGYGLPVLAVSQHKITGLDVAPSDDEKVFVQNWIATLLNNLRKDPDQIDLASTIKKNAEVHFDDPKMIDILADYIGRTEEFIRFIAEKWGWKVECDKSSKTINAKENKTYCVCPVVNQAAAIKPSLICNCSEGFAEKMFSTVFGSPVKATVASSVLRGDKKLYLQNISKLIN